MGIIVHPLIDRRRLLADRFERGMRMQERQRAREPIIGNSVHPHLTVVIGHVFDEPVDAVISVSRFVGRSWVGQIYLRRELEYTFGFEAPPKILDNEDVAILHQFLDRGRHLLWRLTWHAIWRATKQDR